MRRHQIDSIGPMGDVVNLWQVADALARDHSKRWGESTNGPVYSDALAQALRRVVGAAEDGGLKVCNQHGVPGKVADLVREAIEQGVAMIPVWHPPLAPLDHWTEALNVHTRLERLNAWAQLDGDAFEVLPTQWWLGRDGWHPPEGVQGKGYETPETPKERRHRWLNEFEAEKARSERGALQRVAEREGVDRSNMGKAVKKAELERAETARAGGWGVQLVRNGKQ